MNTHRWLACALVFVVSCGGGVNSEEAARASYLGLNGAIEKSLRLGMDGFNAATSANIPEQTTTGDIDGTLAVSGQVDMGASVNKQMRLRLGLVAYQDEIVDSELAVVYDTDADVNLQPALDLSLRDIPDGTFTGTLIGEFVMEGDVTGVVTLNVTLSGEIETDPADPANIRRVIGTTTVTGTATSSHGVFDVDIVL